MSGKANLVFALVPVGANFVFAHNATEERGDYETRAYTRLANETFAPSKWHYQSRNA